MMLLLSLLVLLSVFALILLGVVLVKINFVNRNREDNKKMMQEESRQGREETTRNARSLREEVVASQKTANETVINTVTKIIGEMNQSQRELLHSVEERIKDLNHKNEFKGDELRKTLDLKMQHLQESNDKKLDQMRQTVDEKLQNTLEKRLGESFNMVSERLEKVHRDLGEIQSLATGVGDLKRILTNVKARGTWGEVQLGAILEQILTPEQYDKNVQVCPLSNEMVEFAIRLPGVSGMDPHSPVWLPIDSKFPQEDYQRFLNATEKADTETIQQSTKAFIRSIENCAKSIAEKYIKPPATTDFAILFFPTEGLYAEVLRQPGFTERLQQEYRIVPAGPTTLSAILSSLRMGFRTLVIEKRSSEVWQILSAVKTEFNKFGDVLAKVKKQLDVASKTIDDSEVRARVMKKKLREVETLPEDESVKLLGLSQ